jgi:large subunit ribosomal protein L33
VGSTHHSVHGYAEGIDRPNGSERCTEWCVATTRSIRKETMAKKTKSNFVMLACKDCKARNYNMPKSHMLTSKGNGAVPKLALSKFCDTCRKHTEHVETK